MTIIELFREEQASQDVRYSLRDVEKKDMDRNLQKLHKDYMKS